MSQSFFGIGCIIGVCIMNLISDTKSRKKVLITCLTIISFSVLSNLFMIIIFIVVLFGGWIKSFIVIIVGQLVQGFGISSVIPLSYALLSDFCCDNLKRKAVIFVNTAWYFVI